MRNTCLLFLIHLLLVLYSSVVSFLCENLKESQYRFPRRFHKVANKQKSTLNVISRIKTASLQNCIEHGRERGGMALNFNPNKNTEFNCEILSCPESANSTTLINSSLYDYYSLYGNYKDLNNATCIESIGMFRLSKEKANYTTAILSCQSIGGDLADVITEERTNSLAKLIKGEVREWYQAAYVGLNDIEKEGTFVTTIGEPLSCFKYRAWSPGHPRNVRKHDDCVILDADRTWRVVNCKLKFSFICEIFPSRFYNETTENTNSTKIQKL